jgi:hypothetical protein
MLHAESRIDYDRQTAYPIYSFPAPDGDGMCFLFSPPAAQRFENLIKFWSGITLHEPPDLTLTRRIL